MSFRLPVALRPSHLEMNTSFWHNENMTEPGEQAATGRGADGPQSAAPASPGIVQERGPTGPVKELGGPGGPEPTRFGDWERGGRCIDF